MKDILKEYESCLGQCVNFSKSTIFYSSNTTEEEKEIVSRMLGVKSSSSPEKYLGLPNVVDKITLRIKGWSTRLLSQGGKEIFIKSVLQAIPTYAMSCFLFPKALCEMIESKFARFWWQKGVGKRGIHWCQWRLLCRPKEECGMGFRSMAQFNIALLAKQGWRLLNSPDSLVARLFKAKYFSDSDFRNSSLGNSSSYVWCSIWATKDTLEKGLIWKVGTSTNILIFEDSWIPNYVNLINCNDKVAELINNNERDWNRELIGNTFLEAKAELILRIPLAMEPHEDLLAWNGEPPGEFLVRSSYKLLQSFDPTTYALQNIYRNFY
ncbi:reverse transcriptase [Gossypium australe]|uniref:Reverse transcriptase n=1 Tax=Gossypium australe TaxID=47621 RepID=A0A5B6VCN1_9ROSI|nr:reverse transcriptase [Gossypium australe]